MTLENKSCDTFRHFYFQSEERALGLICRVDLLSSAAVRNQTLFVQADLVSRPLTRQCGPIAGSGV